MNGNIPRESTVRMIARYMGEMKISLPFDGDDVEEMMEFFSDMEGDLANDRECGDVIDERLLEESADAYDDLMDWPDDHDFDLGALGERVKREFERLPKVSDAEDFIKEFYRGESTGHDYWHSMRVYRTAMRICDEEPEADRLLVSMAALLHDVDDRKLGGDQENLPVATEYLREHGFSGDFISDVAEIIRHISFKGRDTEVPDSLEGKIVQDADRLDAIGAIGIARAFAYGGKHGRPICDPEAKPRTDMSEQEYYSGTPDSISHFHEKLLLLKDMMNTAEGKRLAESRDRYMRRFLEEFGAEWNGEK